MVPRDARGRGGYNPRIIVRQFRDAKRRVRALQLTGASCTAAAVVDSMRDSTNWDVRQAIEAQVRLIGMLDGLRRDGATLAQIARAAARLAPGLNYEVCNGELLDAVRWASRGAGVVIGIVPPRGSPGHAIRIRAGDVPDFGPFETAPRVVKRLLLDRRALDELGTAHIFDPWPGPGRLPDDILRTDPKI